MCVCGRGSLARVRVCDVHLCADLRDWFITSWAARISLSLSLSVYVTHSIRNVAALME